MAMTEISQRLFDYLLQDDLTAEEAVAYLKTDFSIRMFSDVLKSIYPYEDMESRLVEAIGSRKTVQNWLQNRNLPTNREHIFRIAFALDIGEYGADVLLKYVFDDGIHYRNERELIYAFALKNHQTYQAAMDSVELFCKRRKGNAQDSVMTTQTMRLAFEQLPPEADFIQFLLSHQNSLGCMHETAYRYFMEMLSYLEQIDDTDETEHAYSVEHICDSYLRMNMPKMRKTSACTLMQRLVKKYWPGVRSVKAMKNHKEDVNRKTLILLYLATGGILSENYDEADEDYICVQERLLANLTRIDQMLAECGMRPMDPRNPFDFLIMFCLRTNPEETMNERMEEVIMMLFGEEIADAECTVP